MLEIQMETVSTCNAKCHFCVYPGLKERHGNAMSDKLFGKIIAEAETIPLINRYVMHGLGEPLLDGKLENRIALIKKGKPDADVEAYTNGLLLSKERFESLRGAGLSSLVISLNAVRAEQHQEIMGMVGKFDQICSNIENAIKAGGVAVHVHAVSSGDRFTNRDTATFYARWGMARRNGHGQVVHEGNWAGDNRTTRKFKPGDECLRAMRQIYVTYDGIVTTCCFDPTGKQVFGDLNRQSLREIYSSDEYVAFREAHSMDEADRYEICAKCTRI